ncbi:sodium/potassium-transporting ATPase subunit beta-1-interacting protein 3-like isoform X2 [Antedon mediterranea]|uniref:sodium/potassium-transporting ATPase subunit beta-1-interacting protein 3-like isoform X2 n=1 Tax=Antedon mediterranea TaxID=105859 RepID=UPI003AF62AB4
MDCCTSRCTLISICALQLLASTEKLVFDFVGYMWTPIIGNFLSIIFTLFGLFGCYQYRPKFLAVYFVWLVLWIGWNIFYICLYLEVGTLSLEENSNILNFNTGSESWWKTNGFGCETQENNTVKSFDEYTSTPPEVTGCLLDYVYIETIHAAVQILLGILGFILAIIVIYKFNEEEDSFDFIGGFDSYSAYNPAANVKGQSLQMHPIYIHHGMT